MEIEPIVLQGNVLDVLRTLPDGTFQTSITSPPFWMLRRYDFHPGQRKLSEFLSGEMAQELIMESESKTK